MSIEALTEACDLGAHRFPFVAVQRVVVGAHVHLNPTDRR